MTRDVVISSLESAQVPNEVWKAFVDNEPVDNPVQYQSHIACAAGKGSWFKQVGRGEKLAEIVLDPRLTTMTEELKTFLDKLRNWCAPA